MRDVMGVRVFEEWRAYDMLEPIGFPMANLRLAYLLATLGNFNGGKSVSTADPSKREPYTIDDYLLRFDLDGPAQQRAVRLSVSDTVKQVNAKMAQLGGQLLTSDDAPTMISPELAEELARTKAAFRTQAPARPALPPHEPAPPPPPRASTAQHAAIAALRRRYQQER